MDLSNLEPDDDEGQIRCRTATMKERTPADVERQVMDVSVQSELGELCAALFARSTYRGICNAVKSSKVFTVSRSCSTEF